MPKCVHNDSKKEINLKNEPSFLCSQEKGKGQPGAGRFFPFRRNAPAVLMNGFSLEAGLLLNALFATLFRNLQRVGACAYGAFLGSKFKRVNSPKFEFTKGPNSSDT